MLIWRYIMKKVAFTLAEVFLLHFASRRKTSFTLVEAFLLHFAGRRKIAFTIVTDGWNQ